VFKGCVVLVSAIGAHHGSLIANEQRLADCTSAHVFARCPAVPLWARVGFVSPKGLNFVHKFLLTSTVIPSDSNLALALSASALVEQP
jgi:hypothetical protein